MGGETPSTGPVHSLITLNIWASGDGALWGGYGTFRRCSLAEGSTSVGSRSGALKPDPTSCSVCFQYVEENVTSSFLFLSPPCLPPLWTLSLWSGKTKINLFFSKLLLVLAF